MSNENLIYVPRNWKVSFMDTNGVEHENVVLYANVEYCITDRDGVAHFTTISGIREEEGKTFICAKVRMYPGTMNVMEKVQNQFFDLDDVVEIKRISTKYAKASRSNRDKEKQNVDAFTFTFDSEKYPSKYRITIYVGEFVALAMKDFNDPNRKKRSIYGQIVDVDIEKNEIRFSRYVVSRGVRDVYECNVSIESLLGIYRYELEISDYVEKETTVEKDTDSAEASTEE